MCSTLSQLVPTDGLIRRHSHLKTGRYHQHLKDHLDLDMSALDYMMQCYPEEKEVEQMRKSLGLYALTGKQQVGHIATTNPCNCILDQRV